MSFAPQATTATSAQTEAKKDCRKAIGTSQAACHRARPRRSARTPRSRGVSALSRRLRRRRARDERHRPATRVDRGCLGNAFRARKVRTVSSFVISRRSRGHMLRRRDGCPTPRSKSRPEARCDGALHDDRTTETGRKTFDAPSASFPLPLYATGTDLPNSWKCRGFVTVLRRWPASHFRRVTGGSPDQRASSSAKETRASPSAPRVGHALSPNELFRSGKGVLPGDL